MKLEESQKRQAQLEAYLYELAENMFEEPALYEMADKLKELYTEGFRHNYSRFYPLIIEVFREDNQYNPDYLSTNIDAIRNLVEKDYTDAEDKKQCRFKGLYMPLTKLSDHINLEIGRYAHTFAREGKLLDLERRSEEIRTQLIDTQESIEKASSLLQNAQKEYITILGIFAAVVLAFTGGIAYSTSVFENLQKASIYRITLMVVLIGFTLFNLFYFLFSYISKIVEKNYSKHSHWLLWITNSVFLVVLALILLAWKLGWVEKRNEMIQNQISSPIQSYSEIIDESNPPIEQIIIEGN